MIRHSPIRVTLLLTVAAVALTSCATFTEDDVAARVGDVELSHAELNEVLERAEIAPDTAASARNFAGLFVASEALTADLATLGVPTESSAASGIPLDEALAQQFEVNREAWQTLPLDTLIDDDLPGVYAGDRSPIVCTAHILVSSRSEAVAAIDEIESGRSFGDVAAETSIDNSAANGGQLGCRPREEFESGFVAEFVEGARTIGVGEVSPPVESQFGFHVITKVEFDQLLPVDILQLRLSQFEDRYDIYVDPQIGQWVDGGFVAPLG